MNAHDRNQARPPADEAKLHYEQCLKLDPIPKEKKAAEKALKEMSGGGSS